MGLADFEIEKREVRFKANKKEFSFEVRGMNLEDLTSLVSRHLADIEAAIELFQMARQKIGDKPSSDAIIMFLAQEAPALAAEIISTLADEPELAEKYRKIPFSVQVIALSHIASITLEEAGGLKNLSAAWTGPLQKQIGSLLRGNRPETTPQNVEPL